MTRLKTKLGVKHLAGLLIVSLAAAPLAVYAAEEEWLGLVTEVREGSFDLRTHDDGLMTFAIPSDLDAGSRAGLRTGNRVQVLYEPGEGSVTSTGRLVGVVEQPQESSPSETSSAAASSRPVEEPVAGQDTVGASSVEDDGVQASTEAVPEQLPKTASSLPLLPTFGFLSLIAAALLAGAARLR